MGSQVGESAITGRERELDECLHQLQRCLQKFHVLKINVVNEYHFDENEASSLSRSLTSHLFYHHSPFAVSYFAINPFSSLPPASCPFPSSIPSALCLNCINNKQKTLDEQEMNAWT